MAQNISYKYDPILECRDSEEEECTAAPHLAPKSRKSTRYFLSGSVVVGILLAIFTTALLFLGVYLHLRSKSFVVECLDQLSWPSPVSRDIDITFHTEVYNGSFFQETVFRQDGSPQVDAAWASLGVNYNPIILPEKDGLEFGLRSDQIRVSEKYGGGYIGYVDGLHHLHCLDLLRQALYFNYEYYKTQGKEPWIDNARIVKKHVSHCLDILRQQLMCTTELGIIGEVWWDDSTPHGAKPRPFVDFSTKHTCRNFDDIREWARVRQMPDFDSLPRDYLVQPAPGDRIFHGIP